MWVIYISRFIEPNFTNSFDENNEKVRYCNISLENSNYILIIYFYDHQCLSSNHELFIRCLKSNVQLKLQNETTVCLNLNYKLVYKHRDITFIKIAVSKLK